MGKIKVPEIGESITEGVLSAWLKKEGEYVDSGEPIYELETDKITTEVPAEESGVLAIGVQEGQTVQIGSEVGELKPGAAPKAKSAPAAAKADGADTSKAQVTAKPVEKKSPVTNVPVASVNNESGATPLSPSIRKALKQYGLTADQISHQGALTLEDIKRTVNSSSTPSYRIPDAPAGPREERKAMSTLRKRIADRLVASQRQTATLTTFNEADMSAVMELRRANKDAFEKKHGVALGFMSFFVKATIAALKAVPSVNASLDGDDVVYHNYYDIGIAVSTDKGLVVPVLRDAEHMSMADIERGILDLATRARESRLTLDDMQGGTFTISNGGVFGSLLSTPILNPPQTGILGMHRIEKRAVVVDDHIVIRPMMYLALSYDHRLIDGKESVTFLKTIKEHIEQPGMFVLEL